LAQNHKIVHDDAQLSNIWQEQRLQSIGNFFCNLLSILQQFCNLLAISLAWQNGIRANPTHRTSLPHQTGAQMVLASSENTESIAQLPCASVQHFVGIFMTHKHMYIHTHTHTPPPPSPPSKHTAIAVVIVTLPQSITCVCSPENSYHTRKTSSTNYGLLCGWKIGIGMLCAKQPVYIPKQLHGLRRSATVLEMLFQPPVHVYIIKRVNTNGAGEWSTVIKIIVCARANWVTFSVSQLPLRPQPLSSHLRSTG